MFSYAIALLFAYTPVAYSVAQPFAAMPTGTYRYLVEGSSVENGNRSSQTFLFRKSGSVVIGAELMGDRTRAGTSVLNCFRGQAEGDRITHVTRVSPPYAPDSNWQSRQIIEIATPPDSAGVASGMASLEENYLPTELEKTALETCIQVFWR